MAVIPLPPHEEMKAVGADIAEIDDDLP